MTRTLAAARLGLREQRRRPIFVALLVILPIWFIARATAVTEAIPKPVELPGGTELLTTMRDLHAVDMAVISVGFLSGLCGVFLMLSAREADRRLVIAGFRPGEAIAARALVLVAATMVVVAVSLLVTMLNFDLARPGAFAASLSITGLLYGALGALAGALLDRIGAVYFMFFAPMVDLGIAQNPMFGGAQPQGWVTFLPGWAPSRLAVDAGFSSQFGAGSELVVALAFAAVLMIVVTMVLLRSFRSET